MSYQKILKERQDFSLYSCYKSFLVI